MDQPQDQFKNPLPNASEDAQKQRITLSSSAKNSSSAEIFKSSQHRLVRFFLNYFPVLIAAIVAYYCVEMFKDGIPAIEVLLSMSFSIFAVALVFWLTRKQKNLYYAIDSDFLYFRGSLNGDKIALIDIKAVYSEYLPTGGKRPALNSKGLIVNYGEGYQLFISPEEEERFLKTLKLYNPRIILDEKSDK